MNEPSSTLKIGKRTFLTAVAILGLLMLLAGILTQVVPAGSYERMAADGREIIRPGSFQYMPKAVYPAWRWLTAPVEVLAGPDGSMVLVIILFILFIAASFSLLESSGVMSAMIAGIVKRFEKRKYVLLSVIVLFFMLMGAVLGTFEENIALIPIVIALAYFLGWDSMVGLGMSILASCFGFAAAISNPFSIAVTQKISGLPLYSASGYRIVVFIFFYLLVDFFLIRYARKIEKHPELSLVYAEDGHLRAKYSSGGGFAGRAEGASGEANRKLEGAMICFIAFMILVFAAIITASVVEGLSDFIMPIIGVLFLTGGAIASRMAGLKAAAGWNTILKGISGMAPGIILILMAMSVKFIISKGGIMDTILYHAASAISGTSPYAAIFMVYILVLALELFIGSSTAKAFLIMPIVAPLADLIGVTRQSTVLAFCFGDGFSNVLYPTNPVLLICLGLTVVSYPRWFKWTIKLQLAAFAASCIFLAAAVALKLGPF